MAKGGGSANKSYLYQETKALLNPTRMMQFLEEKLRLIGTAACPPYHLAIVIGGTSAEYALKTAKYASAKYLDTLPTSGSLTGHGFRDLELEAEVLRADPRSSASARSSAAGTSATTCGWSACPGTARPARSRSPSRAPPTARRSAKITAEGVWLEQLETRPGPVPARRRPTSTSTTTSSPSTSTGRWPRSAPSCRRYPVKTRLSLTGPLVVARDIAHAKIAERLDAGEPMPQYLRDHAVYYAGPAKTPAGYASARSARPRPGGWTPTSSSSRRRAARW